MCGTGELEGVPRKIHGLFKALSEHMPGGTEKNHKHEINISIVWHWFEN
jgi:hypothetical protein